MQKIIGNADHLCRFTLSDSQFFSVKIINQIMEHRVPIDLCAQMHEYRTKTYRCSVHQHEFTRWLDTADALELSMHLPR